MSSESSVDGTSGEPIDVDPEHVFSEDPLFYLWLVMMFYYK